MHGVTRRLISSGGLYEAAAGYSRAVVQDGWVHVAGTTGADPQTGAIPDDAAEQARYAFDIIGAALAEAGAGFEDVVRVTYYLTDASDFTALMPVFAGVFGTIRPAATAVVVAGLVDPAMKIEIEVTARCPQP